jgi:hypothetical protein
MKSNKVKKNLLSFVKANLFLVILIVLLGLSVSVLIFLMSNKVLTANLADETRKINYEHNSTDTIRENTTIEANLSPSVSPVAVKGRIILKVEARNPILLSNNCRIELKSGYEAKSNVVITLGLTSLNDKNITFNPNNIKMDTKYGIVGPNLSRAYNIIPDKNYTITLNYTKFRNYPYKILYQSKSDGIIELGSISY